MSNPANIFLNLQNTTNSVQQVSLFNPNPGLTGTGQGSVISTQYSADLSGELNNGNTAFVVAKQVNESSFTTYRVYNANYAPFTTAQQVADALNTLNIGFFSTDVTNPNLLVSFSNNYVYQSMGLEFFSNVFLTATALTPYNFLVFFNGQGNMVVDFGNGTQQTYLDDNFSNPQITYTQSGTYDIQLFFVDYSNVTGISFANLPIQSIGSFLPYPLLTSINLQNSTISNINIDYIPATVNNFNASLNTLSSLNISNLLEMFVNYGLNNGILDLSNQTPLAPPNSNGLNAKNTLITRGWTVTTD